MEEETVFKGQFNSKFLIAICTKYSVWWNSFLNISSETRQLPEQCNVTIANIK